MSLIKWNDNELFPTFNTMWDDVFTKDFFNKGLDLGTSMPAVNISENEKEFHLEVAVPGLKKEDLEVSLENNVLTISSETKSESETKDKDEKVTRKEFSYSSFKRSFRLPENVKNDKVNAEYVDGILKLDIPKTKPTLPEAKKKITIK